MNYQELDTRNASDNQIFLVLFAMDVEEPVRYEASRYSDLLEAIGQRALERVAFMYAVIHDGEWLTDGPYRFVSGRLGYDCRKDVDFGYTHASHETVFNWVRKASEMGEGDHLIIRLSGSTYERYNSSDDLGDIKHELERRKVKKLLHFTDVENVRSILEHGLLSVEQCALRGIQGSRNDLRRYDGRPDGISLSISRTNKPLLFRFKQRYPGRQYVVLSIDPGVIDVRPCAFFRFNAAKKQYQGQHVGELSDATALSASLNRDRALPQDMPDNDQSEIMVFGDVPSHLIMGVFFESEGALARSRHVLGDVKAKVSFRYFQ